MTEYIRYHDEFGDGVAALYVDGQLDKYGDEYLIDERIATLVGVQERHNNEFYRGTKVSLNPVPAPSLQAIEEWRIEHDKKVQQAEQLRQQAAALIKQAEELEGNQ